MKEVQCDVTDKQTSVTDKQASVTDKQASVTDKQTVSVFMMPSLKIFFLL